MLLLGGAQAAVGARADRPHGLAVGRAEREIPAALREQPRPADPGPSAARLDHRPQRQADRDQPRELPRRHHSRSSSRKTETSSRTLAKLLELDDDDVERIRRELLESRGFQPVPVAENVSYDQYAAVTVRLPELAGSPGDAAASPAYYPDGPAVAHLVGYVGTANAKEYEAENKNPLLIIPGFKIGKQGLEKIAGALSSRHARRPARRSHRARQAGQGTRPQARPQRPDGPADDRPGPAAICGAADGRPVGRPRRDGRGERRHARLRVDAGVRSEQLQRRHRTDRMEDAVRERSHPASQQGRAGALSVRLDDQAGDGAGVPEAGIDPKRRVHCPGGYQIGNRYFRCDAVHGSMDMHSAIERSCNTYFWATGLIDRSRADDRDGQLSRLWPAFRPADPDASASARCRTRNGCEKKYHREWQGYDSANTSIGQGYVLINPMQLAVMPARLASGKLLQPRLLMAGDAQADPRPRRRSGASRVRPQGHGGGRQRARHRGRLEASARRHPDGRQDRDRPGVPARRARPPRQTGRCATMRCSSPSRRPTSRATRSAASSSMAASAPRPPRRSSAIR